MSESLKIRTWVCLGLCLLAVLFVAGRAARSTSAAAATGVLRMPMPESSHRLTASRRTDGARSLWRVSHASFANAQGATPPQGDKPIEQTRKNILVLKGLPESQLFPVMNFMSASLGVKCDFCHVKQGKDPKTGFDNWIWESDDKQQKKTTRNMIRMVLADNNGDFGMGQGAVTCYTCHRGQEHPVGIPPLPLATSGHEGGDEVPAAAGATKPEAPPTAEALIAKYVDAVGGRAAVA
ncbi:MAG: c-type cytochrome, partial [Pyrinomonadaceae bacterium]